MAHRHCALSYVCSQTPMTICGVGRGRVQLSSCCSSQQTCTSLTSSSTPWHRSKRTAASSSRHVPARSRTRARRA
eukprot:6159281-Lingulodinium_polyedra.AAC.1